MDLAKDLAVINDTLSASVAAALKQADASTKEAHEKFKAFEKERDEKAKKAMDEALAADKAKKEMPAQAKN